MLKVLSVSFLLYLWAIKKGVKNTKRDNLTYLEIKLKETNSPFFLKQN